LEEIRGRVQQLLTQGWGLATAPLYRNAIFIMSSSVIGAASGFVFYFIIVRFYSTSDLGYAQGVFNTISFLSTLALLGLGPALVRFLPSIENKAATINTCLTLTGLIALPLTIVLIAGIEFWLPSLNFILSSPVYWVLILLTTFSLTFAPILDQSGLAMRRADLILWRTVLASVLRIPIALLLVLFAVTGGRLDIFVAISLPVGIAVVVEGGILLPRVLPGYRPKPSLDLSHIRPMVRFSTANYLAATIGAADTLLLIPLIFAVLGRSDAPIQAAYFQIATVVAGLLGVIPAAAFASFYAEASQNGATSVDRHIAERRAIMLTLAILLPAIAVLWFFGRFILGLFTGTNSAYVNGSIGPLRILIFGSITGLLNSLLGTRVLIRKQTRPLIVSAIISSTVTLGLGYLLLVWGGITGLAVATVVGSLSQIPYLYLVARKSFGSEVDRPIEVP
jgi:O-antigen/teichoic acid export membrane protein